MHLCGSEAVHRAEPRKFVNCATSFDNLSWCGWDEFGALGCDRLSMRPMRGVRALPAAAALGLTKAPACRVRAPTQPAVQRL